MEVAEAISIIYKAITKYAILIIPCCSISRLLYSPGRNPLDILDRLLIVHSTMSSNFTRVRVARDLGSIPFGASDWINVEKVHGVDFCNTVSRCLRRHIVPINIPSSERSFDSMRKKYTTKNRANEQPEKTRP